MSPSTPPPSDPAFEIDHPVPWGRGLAEYRAFFALENLAPETRILDVAGGPSSFNAEMTEAGSEAVSVDPLYRLDVETIRDEIAQGAASIMAGVRRARQNFEWTLYESPEELETARLAAMDLFLDDFPAGKIEGRYLDASLPDLPFGPHAFDVALVSHFLFTYARQLGLDFHLAGVRELARVAREVRIYPLVELEGGPSDLVAPVQAALVEDGLIAEAVPVPYRFIKGATDMLVIRAAPDTEDDTETA